MKRIICSFLISSLVAVGIISAQPPSAGVDSATTAFEAKMEVYVKENIPYKKPIPFAPVREADVLYEKTVWRLVDLRQKRNHPLYFPTVKANQHRRIGSRVNFFTLLMEAVERGEITAYNPFPITDEFATTQIMTYEDIIKDPNLVAESRTETQSSLATGLDTLITIAGKNQLKDNDVVRLIIKEKYFFDKRHSFLDRRVIGIQPIFMVEQPLPNGTVISSPAPVMWLYFPEIRPLLARHSVFNEFNEANNVSYDDFFMQHRYEGLIIREANIYNNRYINEYQKGLDALFEAAFIEDEVFNWEQDMWEY